MGALAHTQLGALQPPLQEFREGLQVARPDTALGLELVQLVAQVLLGGLLGGQGLPVTYALAVVAIANVNLNSVVVAALGDVCLSCVVLLGHS
jgi:hypothetical protein